MTYRPFFLGAAFFAALFFAAAFLAGAFAFSAFAAVLAAFFTAFFAAALGAPAFAALDAAFFAGAFAARGSRFVTIGSSLIGASVWPIAAPSISTTSDHRRWYVDTSLYGMTCTLGRLRPLRNTFGFTPSVSTSTFWSPSPMRPTRPSSAFVRGAS